MFSFCNLTTVRVLQYMNGSPPENACTTVDQAVFIFPKVKFS